MLKLLFLDFETFSSVPIGRGLDVYFRAAEMLMAQWALGPRPVSFHDCFADPCCPAELWELLNDPTVIIVAHNAQFERYAIKYLWGLDLPPERFFCTMACALAHSLPGGLGLLSVVLKVTTKIEGKDHIRLFCMNQRGGKRATPWTNPDEWKEFQHYAIGDVVTGREVYHALPKRNYTGEHRRLWNVDQLINERGFHVDRELAEAAVELLDADKKRLDGRTQELTEGELQSANQRDKLLLFLVREYGVLLESMQADQLNEALDDDRLPEPVKELIRVRIATAMASTAKFKKLIQCAGPDNRLRNTLQYAGASRTGRWSGRIFQPQNLRRPTMKQADIDEVTRLFIARDPDMITMYADLREAASNMMRGLIVAGPGKKLVVSDWSGIESRVLAWLAGEQWVLDVSMAADKDKKAGDLYEHTVARAYGMLLEEITSYLRQQGKGMVLSLGYEGGVKAFLSIASAYGLDLDELGRVGPDILPSEHLMRSADTWEWAVKKGKTAGLDRAVYIACNAIKLSYREANPMIAAVWSGYKDAFTLCTQYPGEKVEIGRCLFQRRGNWMTIALPSGRELWYPSPKVAPGGQLSYMGQANKQWVRIKTYGGKLAENITQAVSNDILRSALLAAHDDGFLPVLHVHDELVCEQDENDDYHNLARLDAHMRRELSWSKGLPLHTAGWEGTRYKK